MKALAGFVAVLWFGPLDVFEHYGRWKTSQDRVPPGACDDDQMTSVHRIASVGSDVASLRNGSEQIL